MRRSTALMSVAAVAFMASNAFAQAKPSFAGTWTMVVDSAAQAQQMAGGRGGRGGGGGFGQTFTATQDANKLTITQSSPNGGPDRVTVYNLDGSDSKKTVMGRGGEMEVVSHAKWDGNNLVVTTTQDFNGNSMTTTRTISTDDSGNLGVAPTRPGRDGNPMSSTVTYKKGIPVSKDGK
jgi:hypothetical protein